MNTKQTKTRLPRWMQLLLVLLVLGFGGGEAYLQLGSSDTQTSQTTTSPAETSEEQSEQQSSSVRFRNRKLLEEHYEKHGIEMGFTSAKDYEAAAAAVVANPKSLHKLEKEDGDDVYYLEESNEFVIVSTDGYLRTYFSPAYGKSYFDRQ